MSRENKLALVVGFALILLVGILVSDHFSVARQQTSAELSTRALDPTQRAADFVPDLVVFREGQTTPRHDPGFEDEDDVRPVVPVTDLPRTRVSDPVIEMGGVVPGATGRPGSAPVSGQFHDVRPRETLGAICTTYYGDAGLAAELARFNAITDADNVRSGMRLRIPPFAELRPNAPAPAVTPPPSPPAPAERPEAPATREYVVKANDSLGKIARKVLGAERRWNEIYELNRSILKSPDHVVEGTRLILPAR